MRYRVADLSAPLMVPPPAVLHAVRGQLAEDYRAKRRDIIPDDELERRVAMVRLHNGKAGLVLDVPLYIAADPFGRDPLATEQHFQTLAGALALLDTEACPLAELARRRAAALTPTTTAPTAHEGASL